MDECCQLAKCLFIKTCHIVIPLDCHNILFQIFLLVLQNCTELAFKHRHIQGAEIHAKFFGQLQFIEHNTLKGVQSGTNLNNGQILKVLDHGCHRKELFEALGKNRAFYRTILDVGKSYFISL